MKHPDYTHDELKPLDDYAEYRVDFNNCDQEGRVRLNTIGAIRSLNESQVTLRNGLEVELTSGDFLPLKGIVEYSQSERIWVARFDLNDLRDKEIDSPPKP